MKTVNDAIVTSIQTSTVVLIDFSDDAFDALSSKVGCYTLSASGYRFDSGSEVCRNMWTVVVRRAQ
jgi:hypothetical protein